MRKQVLTLTLSMLLMGAFCYAQEGTIWFDANWKETTKEYAVYCRKAPKLKGKGFWFEYFYINGNKQMEGLSLKKDKEVYDGLVIWYYENGNIFQKVNYINGYLNGRRLVYFEEGGLKVKLNYERGRKNGLSKEYYKDGRLKAQGNYRENKKVGTWKRYYYDGYEGE